MGGDREDEGRAGALWRVYGDEEEDVESQGRRVVRRGSRPRARPLQERLIGRRDCDITVPNNS